MQIRPANPTPGPVNILSKAATAAHTNRGQTDAKPRSRPKGLVTHPEVHYQLAACADLCTHTTTGDHSDTRKEGKVRWILELWPYWGCDLHAPCSLHGQRVQ